MEIIHNLPRGKIENANGKRPKYRQRLSDAANDNEFLTNSDDIVAKTSLREHPSINGKMPALVLDRINLGIVEMLVNNGDIKSADIAAKLKVPLSTIQRRRSHLERNAILKKNYYVDLKRLGLRTAEISVATKNGESQNVLNTFFNRHKRNIIDTALRIGNPDTNISFRVAYADSRELFNLLEEIKEMEIVSEVQWSEYIAEKKNQTASISDLLRS